MDGERTETRVDGVRTAAAGGGATAGLIGLAMVAFVLVIDRLIGDRGLLHERPPEWSVTYLFRALLLGSASLLLVWWARRSVGGRPSTDPVEVTADVVIAGALAGGLALAAAALVVLDPERLTTLVAEDGPIEWLTAALAFLAGPMIAVAAVRSIRSNPGAVAPVALLVIGSAAAVSVLIGLEEVSWFQRVIDFESPETFAGRNQAEFNLHNGATGLSENAYYVGSFVAMVAAPALLTGRPLPGRLAGLEPAVPGRTVLYGSVPAGALIYEMWEIVPLQIVFFASVGLLLTDGARFRSWRLGPAMAALLVLVVVVFLTSGDRMVRSWDDTEVRELLPAFGLFLYGRELLGRSRSGAAPADRGRRPRAAG